MIKFGSLTREAGYKRGRPFFTIFKITCLTMTMSTGQIEGGGPRSQCSEFSGVNYGKFPGEQCKPNTAEAKGEKVLLKEKQDV